MSGGPAASASNTTRKGTVMADLSTYIPGDVYQRQDYGAPATPGGARRPRSRVVGMTVHWTTGTVLGEASQLGWVGNIYRYHTQTRGWADIGYAYLFHHYGNVYVGRGRYRALAHASGYNTTWLGCAFLGGNDSHVSDEALAAAAGLRSWLRREGGMTSMTRVNGHRDIGSTACPGDRLHSWVHAGMNAPDVGSDPDPGRPDPMRYDMMLYAHRGTPDALAMYAAASSHNAFAVMTHSRGEATDAIDRGEQVVAVGGPAARDLVDDPGAGINGHGDATTVVGADRAETLELITEWCADNL